LPASVRAHLEDLRREAMAEAIAADAAPDPRRAVATAAPALAGTTAESESTAAEFAHPRPRWPWLGLGVLLLALLATLLLPLPARLRPGQSEALPQEVLPPPPALSDTMVVTHPDYAQLAAPDSEGIAREMAMFSWLAAASPASPVNAPPATAGAPANFAELSGSERHMLAAAASVWPALAADEREALRANAADWRARPAPQRAGLKQRLLAWDRQAAAARARRRAPFLSWQALPGEERARVRDAQVRLAAMPAAEQAALRAQFAALDADTQRVWWLGPALGQQLAPIAALFAFLPEADRPALLHALRELDAGALQELATLAPRLDEAQRQALRQELLALPAAERGQFIHGRLLASGALQ
jgi:hypothetical protein